MTAVATIAGVILILLAVHDIFETLFHPASEGAGSLWIAKRVWGTVRRLARRRNASLTLAGPVAVVSIVLAWFVVLLLGYTLVYLPHLDTYFVAAPGLGARPHRTILDAVNVSLDTLITISTDYNPTSKVLKLVMGTEATLGLGLLAAAASWLISIYPVLERRRTLGHQVTLLHAAELKCGDRVLELPASDVHALLTGLAGSVAGIRNDLTHFPVTYFFASGDDGSAVPGILMYLAGLADEAARDSKAEVRIAGTMLGGAVEDYVSYLSKVFLDLPEADKDEVMRAYARDHMRSMVTGSDVGR